MAEAIESTGIIALLADRLGAPEPGIRLVMSIFAGYPIAFIYRFLILPQTWQQVHHIFFALSGFGLCFFNYGFDSYHSLICIWVTYQLVLLLHNSPERLIAANFIFHMVYLLTGYYFTQTNEYDIVWTTSHCVLTLRMIGFAFDVADGRQPTELLSKDQMDCYLEQVPSLLELSAFAYFPSAFLVGPQFPFRRYQRFIAGEFAQYKGFVKVGVTRLLLGISYLAIHQVGGMMLPDSYFLTDEYRNEPFVWRLIYLGLLAKICVCKYVTCWLLAEGSLICLGFSYNGKLADGTDDWYGCSNVKLYLLETGNTMDDYIRSFNIKTNQWVAFYVYKRLKFFKNRYTVALIFLAVWHGWHSGYYMSFLMECITITAERQIDEVYRKSCATKYSFIESSTPFKLIKFVALKIHHIIYLGWCFTPFIFLTFERWMDVFKSVKFFGFIHAGVLLITFQVYTHYNRDTDRFFDAEPTSTYVPKRVRFTLEIPYP